MEVYNISHAKTQLSALIARVEKGEEIIIGRADKPLAKIVPYVPAEKPGFLGAARGRIAVPDIETMKQWTEESEEMDLFANAA
ncbi:MAG TPA: type II toxin-antitoxin system prevent-host-death family antitoxin [Alphaproteobacteria bacterium]